MAAIRVSPGVYRDSKTGKTVRALTQAAANKMLGKATAAKAGNAQAKIPGASAAVNKAITAETAVADQEAGKQIALQNPDYTNPLGSQTTTQNADGSVKVDTQLSTPQQNILSAGEGLTSMGQGLAKQQLGSYKQFNFGANSAADRSRIEDEVFDRLTRNTDRDYAREKEQMEQTLHNRGIALDPADAQYKSNIGALDERYDTLRANARADATQLGGEEMSRAYGMELGTHQQGLNDASALQGMGTGLMMPNMPGYQAPTYDLSNPSELDLAFKGLNQNQQQIEIAKKRAAAAAAGTTDTQSPFDT